LQQVLGRIREHGASLVALTPQSPEHSRGLAAKQQLGYELLSDPGNAYAAKLGLRFALPDDLRAVYASRGLDLPSHNGDPSWTLPMPGRFVIDRTGVVRTVDVDPDYTRRPEPDKTLADLAALK
jgi:peroxiredoxin